MEGLKKEYVFSREVTKFSLGLEKLAKDWMKQKKSEANQNSDVKRVVNMYTRLNKETGEKYYEVVCTTTIDDIEIIPEEDKV